MKNNLTGETSIIINAPATRVWETLITPSLIKQYFFGTNVLSDWKVGSPIIFKGEWQGKTYEDKGHIMEIEPNHLLRYSYWSSMSGIEDKPENYLNITYKLDSKKNETLLTITQENIPDEKSRDHSEGNWNKVLRDLKKLLEKKTTKENVHA